MTVLLWTMPAGIREPSYFSISLKLLFSPALGVLIALLGVPCLGGAQPDAPEDLQLEPLRTWIKQNWYDGFFTNLGYNTAREQMYGFVDASGGQIECIYTGFQQASGFVTYPNPINAEHIVPQSFYGSASPMKSDIWSIRPCHGSANSARSNDPYGEVGDGNAQWYGTDGSGNYLSTGTMPSNPDDFSEASGSIWEPREAYKGDVARSVFYFYTMYPTQAGDISGVCDPATLYAWHLADPVSAVEQTRNDRTEIAQGNRNPFVDHPDWVYDAWFWEPPTDIPGCTFASACNYEPEATFNDGTCILLGSACDDGDADTFDDVYTDCGQPNYGCTGTPITVPGCTDPAACNYDAGAGLDDGSCILLGAACDDGDANTLGDVYTNCEAPDYGCAGAAGPPTTPEGPILYRAAFHTTGLSYGFDGDNDVSIAAGETEWFLMPSPGTEAMWTETFLNDTVMAVRNTEGLVTWSSREIDVQGVMDLAISADFTGHGGMTGPMDYLEFTVLLDGQPLFVSSMTGDGASGVDMLSLPAVSSIVLQVQMRNDAVGEVWRLDEMLVFGTPPAPSDCPADLDGDGLVAVGDVLMLLGQFGCLADCTSDITGDDAVTTADMLAILAQFGDICP